MDCDHPVVQIETLEEEYKYQQISLFDNTRRSNLIILSTSLFLALQMFNLHSILSIAALTQLATALIIPSNHLSPVGIDQYLEKPLNGYHFGSISPDGVDETYNYCNMPRTNNITYEQVNPEQYKLKYVELVHRHHKRTPYESNLLPTDILESYYSYPEITNGGQLDSYYHGVDLWTVYHDFLGFLPTEYDPSKIGYRVTNNNITTEVFNSLIKGMYPAYNITPELRKLDNLEPNLPCSNGDALKETIRSSDEWYKETNMTIYNELADKFGITPANYSGFWGSIDHFFDNLSSKTCEGSAVNVTKAQLEQVLKMGHWEWDYTYRGAPLAQEYGSYIFGNWTMELADHLKAAIDGSSPMIYKHNIGHDGSIGTLTAVLKDFLDITTLQWPGMGSEYVFELYEKLDGGDFYLRVMYAGRELTFTKADDFFSYLDKKKVASYSSSCTA